jgi:valyl-tRNA synthetase
VWFCSQRGGEVIEPLVSAQWFVRMPPLAQPALTAVDEGHLKIVPERFEKVRVRPITAKPTTTNGSNQLLNR